MNDLQHYYNFNMMWNVSLIILLVVGYLFIKAINGPSWLGGLISLAGIGYIFDSFVVILNFNFPIELSFFTFVGEFILIFGYLLKAEKLY